MDITKLQLSDTTTLEILNPKSQTPTGIKITLLSSDSEAIQDVIRANMNKRIRQAQLAGAKFTVTAEQREEEGLDLLVQAVKGWEGLEVGDGPLPCTPENVREVLSNPAYAWIRKQIDGAFSDQTRFFE